MIYTTCQSFDDKKIKKTIGVVTGVGTYGMGLWTSICYSFATVFGRQCKTYSEKVRLAKAAAVADLNKKAIFMKANAIVDVKFQVFLFSVMVTGTAVEVEE